MMRRQPRIVRLDWARLSEHLEQLRAVHDNRTEDEGIQATLEHWHRTSTVPPASFFEEYPAARAAWHRIQQHAATGATT